MHIITIIQINKRTRLSVRRKQEIYLISINEKIVADLINNKIEFVTTVPCKQLAGVIDEIDAAKDIYHIPSNKEDEGMGLCAGAYMGGKRSAIIMQNTAIGVAINTLVTLIQYYNIPLPMLISYRGELGEPVAALDDAGGMAHCSCVNATNQTAVEGPKIRGKSK